VTDPSEAVWEAERAWPLWQVVITGDEVDWVARAGVNVDDDGVAQPWRAAAKATVTLRARNEEHAKALALAASPGYHSVESVREVDE
jgi:hypothetical protein